MVAGSKHNRRREHGYHRFVPQGARLIGIYDSQVAFGQSRVLLVWTRLIMPNGRSIVLERQQGADAGGYSGLEDEVDNHWTELFKAALLSTILGVGAELGSGADNGSNTDIIQALRLSAANSLNQTGQQVVRRNLNIQPTLTIRPGFPVSVILHGGRGRGALEGRDPSLAGEAVVARDDQARSAHDAAREAAECDPLERPQHGGGSGHLLEQCP